MRDLPRLPAPKVVMSRPVKPSDVVSTLRTADNAELLDWTWRAVAEAEDRLEDAAAELHRAHLVMRELAERLGCAPVPHMESLSVLSSEGEPGEPYA